MKISYESCKRGKTLGELFIDAIIKSYRYFTGKSVPLRSSSAYFEGNKISQEA